VVAAVACLGACVNSERASTQRPTETLSVQRPTSSAPATEPATPPTSDARTAAECTADNVTVAGAPNAKPQITLPDNCSAPTTLLVKDVVAGTGAEITQGANMLAHYTLMTWSDRAEVDSSWQRGDPFPLENIGQASVIAGWNEGLIGLKQGGRRLLIVPPDKGYGPQGQGPIKPNETLVFVIDAVQVTPPA
jgi:peptidylprolyl isomerase